MGTWDRYYQLKRQIEAGESRDWRTLERLREIAVAEARQVTANWHALGLTNR